jgi:hypothetical protein
MTPNTKDSLILFSDPEGASGQIDYSHSADSMTFVTNGASAMTILSSGNVGIGSTAPGKSLDIVGSSSAVRIFNTTSTYNPEVLYIAEPSFGTQYGLRFRYDPSQSGALGIYKVHNFVESTLPIFSIQRGTESVGIGTDMVGTSGKLIVLGGNVGIGTTVPGTALDVVGAARVSNGVFTASGNTGSIATNTPTTIFSVAGSGIGTRFEISACLNSVNATQYAAFATVIFDGTNARIVSNDGTILFITLSGTNVQVDQNSGVNQTIHWKYLRI